MEENYYKTIERQEQITDIDNFREYLLTKDTIIIPDDWELECSEWVTKKIHDNVDEIKDKYFYRDGDTIYFIYSKYFDEIWEVKVFFDTTTYIHSQLIIIKTGLIFIFLVFILQFFWGRYISKRLLKDLTSISEKVKSVDINSNNKHVICQNMPQNDEIRILAEALNESYDTIDSQTSKLKQFLTDVSHEFKTPLMALSSRLDLLDKKKDRGKLWDSDISKLFSDTRQNISKLNWLLESLFFLSRIEEQAWCLVTQQLQLKSYMENKVQSISESFPHKNISYDLHISDAIEYNVEENTFSILIDNLLSNAIKFSPQDAVVTIKAGKKYISVTDNGPWIDKNDRERIWEKFYRKDTNKEWFGVWLYLVKRIADIYGWAISISGKKWEWATFKIDLR